MHRRSLEGSKISKMHGRSLEDAKISKMHRRSLEGSKISTIPLGHWAVVEPFVASFGTAEVKS
jgi:hypothetical protein